LYDIKRNILPLSLPRKQLDHCAIATDQARVSNRYIGLLSVVPFTDMTLGIHLSDVLLFLFGAHTIPPVDEKSCEDFFPFIPSQIVIVSQRERPSIMDLATTFLHILREESHRLVIRKGVGFGRILEIV
jgi:hypothetical protein